jgi:hypothetical protein
VSHALVKRCDSQLVNPVWRLSGLSQLKDPNAPKKPLGAYMWFCKDMRESVKAEHPGMSVTDIGKRLGELWKEVNEQDKKK